MKVLRIIDPILWNVSCIYPVLYYTIGLLAVILNKNIRWYTRDLSYSFLAPPDWELMIHNSVSLITMGTASVLAWFPYPLSVQVLHILFSLCCPVPFMCAGIKTLLLSVTQRKDLISCASIIHIAFVGCLLWVAVKCLCPLLFEYNFSACFLSYAFFCLHLSLVYLCAKVERWVMGSFDSLLGRAISTLGLSWQWFIGQTGGHHYTML